MESELPLWQTVYADRNSWRAWKRVVRNAGKRSAFNLLEPKIRQLATKVRNAQHSAHDKQRSLRPTDRKAALLQAFDEIRDDRELVVARTIAANPSDHVLGVTGVWPVP